MLGAGCCCGCDPPIYGQFGGEAPGPEWTVVSGSCPSGTAPITMTSGGRLSASGVLVVHDRHFDEPEQSIIAQFESAITSGKRWGGKIVFDVAEGGATYKFAEIIEGEPVDWPDDCDTKPRQVTLRLGNESGASIERSWTNDSVPSSAGTPALSVCILADRVIVQRVGITEPVVWLTTVEEPGIGFASADGADVDAWITSFEARERRKPSTGPSCSECALPTSSLAARFTGGVAPDEIKVTVPAMTPGTFNASFDLVDCGCFAGVIYLPATRPRRL